MKLSVIILNYNVRYFLEQCIQSVEVALRSFEAEIIVADNASTDGSREMMANRFPHIQYLENNENLGFSKANNLAVARAQGDYICILNPDTIVPDDIFIKTLSYAEAIDDLGALGVQLMDGTGNFLPECKRNLPTPKRSLLKLLGQGKKSGYYAENPPSDEVGVVEVLVGAFMLMKRNVFEEVGGFDEDYFMYGEDIDLCYKITKAGFVNHYLGNIRMLHYKGESTSRDKEHNRRFYGAMKIFFKKHFSGNSLMNLMVSLAVMFMKMAGRRPKNISVPSPEPEIAYLFSEDLSLRSSMTGIIDIPIKTTSKSVLNHENFNDSMMIFDATYLSYSQIFTVMDRYKNNGNRFRIVPPGSRFIIGSDRSDDKGTVLVF